MWNFGSILGISLVIQLVRGILLALHYSADPRFRGVIHIIRDIPGGIYLRLIHANGARLYFVLIYIHLGRALYFQRWITQPKRFLAGISIFLLRIAVAFLGYVLPWGQISLWGATVITNLISAIPYIGTSIVNLVWGGFTVRQITLGRFYVLHFLLPFLVALFVLVHLFFLHYKGRTNPLGNLDNQRKVSFHPYFRWKDGVGFAILGGVLIYLISTQPYSIIDPENFIEANNIVTPPHIQPEWYFLFAYAILRCIPSKVGGVIGLVLSITLFYVYPLARNRYVTRFSPLRQIIFWGLVVTFIILSFLGAAPVESPFPELRAVFSLIYFTLLSIIPCNPIIILI